MAHKHIVTLGFGFLNDGVRFIPTLGFISDLVLAKPVGGPTKVTLFNDGINSLLMANSGVNTATLANDGINEAEVASIGS